MRILIILYIHRLILILTDLNFWNYIHTIGVKSGDSTQVLRQKKMNNQVTLFTTLSTLVFIPYLYMVGNYYYIPYELATTALIILAFGFNHFGLLKTSMFWRYFVILADVTFAALEMPGAGVEYFLIPLGLIPFILSNSTATQMSLLATALVFFFLRLYISENHYTPHSVINPITIFITYVIVLTMVFILCALFVIKYKLASIKYEGLVEHQLKEIEEKQKEILDSIHYAKRIQTALLTHENYFDKNLNRLSDPKEINKIKD